MHFMQGVTDIFHVKTVTCVIQGNVNKNSVVPDRIFNLDFLPRREEKLDPNFSIFHDKKLILKLFNI